MKDKEFIKIVQQYIKEGNNLITEEREILVQFKKTGGKQETAKKMLEDLALSLSNNEILQDRVYDILDIVTGWCSDEIRVWR